MASKKDETRAVLERMLMAMGEHYPYLRNTLLEHIDAYGAACAEEALGVVSDADYDRREGGQSETGYALRMAADDLEARPDDREAIIEGLVSLLRPNVLSVLAEQRGYEKAKVESCRWVEGHAAGTEWVDGHWEPLEDKDL